MYHFDTYRLEDVEEVSYLGFDEYFYGDGVCVIEWADRIATFLPEEYLEINISDDRSAELIAKLETDLKIYWRIYNVDTWYRYIYYDGDCWSFRWSKEIVSYEITEGVFNSEKNLQI